MAYQLVPLYNCKQFQWWKRKSSDLFDHFPLTKALQASYLTEYFVRLLLVITQSLTAFFNRCIKVGDFPLEWKTAHVIPLYKGKGDPTNPSMYRPISLLHSVAKLYESLISQQLYSFVENNNILSDNQYGFRRRRLYS